LNKSLYYFWCARTSHRKWYWIR